MGSPQSLYGYTGPGTTAVIAWNINIIMNLEIIISFIIASRAYLLHIRLLPVDDNGYKT